jgi:dynein heavy chain, axonemal
MDTKERRWLVFDGPVDAIWIENMNTVLDDNKKLCLNSGEIIQMSNNMSMIFEPQDLTVASPATVSRCGMVYMQPLELGWRPLVHSWKNNLPHFLHANEKNREIYLPAIDELIDVMVQPLLNELAKNCKITTPSNEQKIVFAFLRLWRSLLTVFETEGYDEQDKKKNISIIDSCFLWSFIWSVCCVVDTAYRKPVDLYVKQVASGQVDGIQKFQSGRKILPGCMDRGTIYDYVYFSKTDEWKQWLDLSNKDEVDKFPAESQVQDIIVTTVDKIRYSYIQEYCISHMIPTLFVGPTGTGKSVYIQNVLLN